MPGWAPEVEVDEFPRYSYRDGTADDAKVLAEFDDIDAKHTVLRALIEDGHPSIKAWVDGQPSYGSYGDYGVV